LGKKKCDDIGEQIENIGNLLRNFWEPLGNFLGTLKYQTIQEPFASQPTLKTEKKKRVHSSRVKLWAKDMGNWGTWERH
jgi:hypothetical protein